MTHDWFNHGPNETADPFRLPLEPDDPWSEAGARRSKRTASHITKASVKAARPKSVTHTRWGRASSSRKSTVTLERRRSSETTTRTGCTGSVGPSTERILRPGTGPHRSAAAAV